MTAAAKPDRQSVRRTLRLIWILQGNTIEGLCLKQIAEALKTSAPNAFRDLEVMAEEGVAERIPGRENYWRLTPKLIQLARAHEQEIQRHLARIQEIDQRYTREPK